MRRFWPLGVCVVVLVVAGRWPALLTVPAALVLAYRPSRREGKGRKRVNLRGVMGPAGKHMCVYCGDRAQSWDHVVPVALGGSDEPANLVPACTPCNSSKSDTPLWEWLS